MYSYLISADSNGGVVDGSEIVSSYWTMNANSDEVTTAWTIRGEGLISSRLVYDAYGGARAVIEINK